jgi:hypothetical protein
MLQRHIVHRVKLEFDENIYLDVIKLSIELAVLMPVNGTTSPATVFITSIPNADLQARYL